MSEQFIWSVFIQLIKGLKALHDLNILHRDLKSANVFLNTDGSVKLGDMNVSKVAKNGFLYTQTGTPYYASPEVWKDLPYNSKSDIWSLGCVLYEASTLRPPFRAEDMKGLFKKVIKGEYKPLSRVFSRELNMIISMLMVVDPVKRPTCGKNYVGNLLQMDIVLKRMKALETVRPESAESRLLDPIKLPKDIAMITNSLPGPDYRNEIRLNHSEPPPPIKRNNSNFSLPKISKEPKNYSQSINPQQSKSSLVSASTNQSREYSSQPHSILSASPERTSKHPPKLESDKKCIPSPYYYSHDSHKSQHRSKLASLPESVLPSSYGRNNYLQRIMHIKNTYGLPSVSHNVREYRRVSPSKAGTKLAPIRVIQEEGM